MDSWNMPIIDVEKIGLAHKSVKIDNALSKKIGDELVNGLKKYGVVYLINHGISDEKLKEVREIAHEFFKQPLEVKLPAHRRWEDVTCGWLGMGMEYSGNDQLEGANPGDIKESYNIHIGKLDTFPWPDEKIVPGFRAKNRAFFEECIELTRRLLVTLDASLTPEDHTIQRSHVHLATPKNGSHGKCLRYPPVDKDVPGSRTRLGEHTDWGTFTLVMQDYHGGLRLRDRDGNRHIPEVVPGAIILQAADMLQRWTSDAIWSMPHGVVIQPETRDSYRESQTYFVVPDDGFPIVPLDGSDLYPPIDMADYALFKTSQYQPDDKTLEERALKNLAK